MAWEPFGWDIDWGSVPAWAGSILTSGSLVLGFSILTRDRRREARKQAAAVVLTIDVTYPSIMSKPYGDAEVHLAVHNASDAPISYVRVRYLPFPSQLPAIDLHDEKDPYKFSDLATEGLHDVVLTDRVVGAKPLAARATRLIKMLIPHFYSDLPLANTAELRFVDIAGNYWVRRAIDGKLRQDKDRLPRRSIKAITRSEKRRFNRESAKHRSEIAARFAEARKSREDSSNYIRNQLEDRRKPVVADNGPASDDIRPL